MNELNPKEIAERIKQWLKAQYGTIDEGARQLGKTPVNLRNSALKGKTLPSTDLMAELIKRGADYNWILFGSSAKVKEPQVEYKVKKLETELKELKQENEQLRTSINRITSVTLAEEESIKKKRKGK